jgi:hypothetical protein
MPCKYLEKTVCSIYESRPKACHKYECQVLKDFKSGAKTLDECKTLISEVRALQNKIGEKMGGPIKGRALWKKLKVLGESKPDTNKPASFFFNVAALFQRVQKFKT